MNVLLVGGGGREHALAWKLKQSSQCQTLYCAPGNAGIAEIAHCIDIPAHDVESLVHFAVHHEIDFVIIAPEEPLVLGLADRLTEKGIKVFGPLQAAAQLEGSKGFMKDLCAKYNIPTAAYGRFTNIQDAASFIEKQTLPIVLKTDGLAAGKGVIIAQTKEEALTVARDMLSGVSFGKAGNSIVIEEFLDGEEVSFFALADGKTILPLSSAQDYKRAYDGDQGPNTGGMGAYSPAHMMTPALEQNIIDQIITPTVQAMSAEGCPFTGVLFAGLMIVNGSPILIEFNIRFGDPECQTLMMRLESDLLEILLAGAESRLSAIKNQIKWQNETALCVVMAAKGYPGAYSKHTTLMIDSSRLPDRSTIFHAGTARNKDNDLINTGGRVLNVTSLGKTIEIARKNVYNAIEAIYWPEGFYRKDIGEYTLAKRHNDDKSYSLVKNSSV